MACTAIGQITLYDTSVTPLLIRICDMIRTELTKHRASPGKFFICVRIISDKATLPSVEILKLRIQFTGEKCFFVMQKARNLTIGVFIVGKNNSIDATLVVSSSQGCWRAVPNASRWRMPGLRAPSLALRIAV